MSQSFSVECPNCHAKGELADASLLGQQIACPGCQHVFVIPLASDFTQPVPEESMANFNMPPAAAAMVESGVNPETAPVTDPGQMSAAPVPVSIVPEQIPVSEWPTTVEPPLTSPATTSPANVAFVPESMPGAPMIAPVSLMTQPDGASFAGDAVSSFPVMTPPAGFGSSTPQADFMTPSQFPGAAEEQFAANLALPSTRGSIKPHQPKSKLVTTLAWGSVAFVILFTMIMFLLGDPFRKPNQNPTINAAKKASERSKQPQKALPTDKSLDDMLKKLQEASK